MQKILPFSFFPLLVVAHALAYHSLLSVKGFAVVHENKISEFFCPFKVCYT